MKRSDGMTEMAQQNLLLGVDTGGTFTDFVLIEDQEVRLHKVLSTPDAPERAILQGIQELGVQLDRLHLVHGSTVATNAVLEGKGVRTAFITNHGLGDMLTLGRQARKELYNLQPAKPTPPVPPELCLETGGRISASGYELESLTAIELAQLKQALEELKPDAVAINLLFSFLDDRNEKTIESIVPEGIFISRSSSVLPEYREYERGITTWLNAYVGPLVQGYLQRLADGVKPASVAVMQSTGGTIEAEAAGRHAVQLLLSGPAGGLMGARFIGESLGCDRLMTFDMGGTSTDVALIDGEVRLTNEGSLGDYPVAVPMVDMHTIGAGGGSIARVDGGGLLQVGPESAGARPGPACYGQGGILPTVTDANLVLGRLQPGDFLGGRMTLDVDAARQAIGQLADSLDVPIEVAALGVVRIANDHMARALRVISVQRGEDPANYTLMSFGGAGGLHVCDLADELQMTQAIVPVNGGVLSALGMLAAPRARHYSHTVSGLLRSVGDESIEGHLVTLQRHGEMALADEGYAADTLQLQPMLDLRYQGQSYTLTVPWQGVEVTEQAFHVLHRQRYGHALEVAVELVNVRLALSGPEPELSLSEPDSSAARPPTAIKIHGMRNKLLVWPRATLEVGQMLTGPLLITEEVSTTWVAPGWNCKVGRWGNLLLSKMDG